MDDDTQVVVPQAAPEATAVVEDTAQVQPNMADVQVDNQAPLAAQDVKDPAVTATDTAEERLYAGKYKTAEDLEKAYTELQPKATKDAQEKAELARILNEAFATPQPEPQVQQAQQEYEDEDPVVTVDPRIDALEKKSVAQDFMFLHPDANPQALAEVFKSDPYVNTISDYNARLEYAYLKSQSIASPQVIEQARQEAAQQTQVKFAEKQAAQVETVQKQAQPAGKEEISQDQLRSTLRNDKDFDQMIQDRFPGISKMRTRT